MPPIDEATEPFFYLVEHLFRVGPSLAGEMVSHQEIAAWAGFNGYALDGWEAEALQRLSGAYVGEYHAAADDKREPPFTPSTPVVSRAEVSQRILAAFMALAGQGEGPDATPKTPAGRRSPGRTAPAVRAPRGSSQG